MQLGPVSELNLPHDVNQPTDSALLRYMNIPMYKTDK